MNPSPRATALILARKEESILSALRYLPAARVADAVPALIAKLDHASETVRTLAENRLVEWTGTELGRSWKGYKMGRPTRAEGKIMKAQWEQWWQRNKQGFRPKVR